MPKGNEDSEMLCELANAIQEVSVHSPYCWLNMVFSERGHMLPFFVWRILDPAFCGKVMRSDIETVRLLDTQVC